MSTHLCIGKDKNDADLQKSLLYLEDDFMGFVYCKVKKVKKKYPMLYRLVFDSYGDYEFFPEDLLKMKEDVINFLDDKTLPKDVRKTVQELLKIINTAILQNKGVFSNAD